MGIPIIKKVVGQFCICVLPGMGRGAGAWGRVWVCTLAHVHKVANGGRMGGGTFNIAPSSHSAVSDNSFYITAFNKKLNDCPVALAPCR